MKQLPLSHCFKAAINRPDFHVPQKSLPAVTTVGMWTGASEPTVNGDIFFHGLALPGAQHWALYSVNIQKQTHKKGACFGVNFSRNLFLAFLCVAG